MISNPTNTTQLFYNGNVTIDLVVNGKYIKISKHNNGMEALKKAFAKFLCGQADIYSVPQFLDLIYTTDTIPTESSEWRSYLVQEIPLSAKQYQQVSGTSDWQAILTGTIRYEALESVITQDTPGSFRLVLETLENEIIYPPQGKYQLAYIDVDKDDLINIVEGTQAIVYWKMQLINSDQIQEEA